ncbi:hypothetical protein DBR40_21520 [Pedobacter sp. KBW01]|uniref:hypothetical protein n=1 Tax=Pedobacter sp. KBW01 TaxID=2153364 RepID=UPI000F5B06C9|nr:hypothetical protein [Pedobacter sp. KBW01]RQO66835.1 hypothetical protein DBR40_21520 [Pedobacter sp. KBW01]
MKKNILMETDLSAAAQQPPTNKIRSSSDYSQVDNYLIALKRMGIPTSDTDSLDAPGLPQNTVKIIFNTSLGKLRIYNPVSEIWTDAAVSDLANYLPLTGGTLTGPLYTPGLITKIFSTGHPSIPPTISSRFDGGPGGYSMAWDFDNGEGTHKRIEWITGFNEDRLTWDGIPLAYRNDLSNYVDLTTAQDVGGDKFFTGNLFYPNVNGGDYDGGYGRLLVTSAIPGFGGRVQYVNVNSLPFLSSTGGDLSGTLRLIEGQPIRFIGDSGQTGFIGDPGNGTTAISITGNVEANQFFGTLAGNVTNGVSGATYINSVGNIILVSNGDLLNGYGTRFRGGEIYLEQTLPIQTSEDYSVLVRDITSGAMKQVAISSMPYVENTRAISDSYQSGGLALSTGKFGQLAVNTSEPAGNFHVRGTSFLDASSGSGGVQFYGVAEGNTGGINIGSAAENVAPSTNHYPLVQDVNTGLMKRSSKRGLYEGDVPVSPTGEFIYASPSTPQNASISLDNANIRISGNRFQGLYAPRVRVNTITDNDEFETPGLNITSSSSLAIAATTNMGISAEKELFFNMGGTGSSILLGNYNIGGVERLALSGAKVELVETPPVATSNYSLLVRQDNGGELKTIDENTFITKNTSTLPLNEGTNNLGFQKNSDDTFTANGYMNIKSVAGAPIASIGEAYNTFYGAMVLTDNPAYPGYNYFETQDLSTGNRASLKTSGIGFNRADGYLNLIPESSIIGGHNVTFPTPVTNATVAYTSDLGDYLPLAGGGTITNGSGNSTTMDGLRLSFSTGAFLQHANGQKVFFGDSEGEFLGIQRNRLSLTGPGYLGSKSVSIGANLLTDNRDCELPNESGTLLTEKSGVILTPNDYSPQTGKIHINGTMRSNGVGGYYGGNSNYQLGVNGEGLYITQNTGQSYFGGSSLLFQDSSNPKVFTGFDAGRIFFRNTVGDTHHISIVRPYQGTLTTGVDIELPGTSGRLLTEQLAASTYTLLVNTSSAAPGPTSTGVKGQIIAADGYRYECIDTNTWVRSAVETTW